MKYFSAVAAAAGVGVGTRREKSKNSTGACVCFSLWPLKIARPGRSFRGVRTARALVLVRFGGGYTTRQRIIIIIIIYRVHVVCVLRRARAKTVGLVAPPVTPTEYEVWARVFCVIVIFKAAAAASGSVRTISASLAPSTSLALNDATSLLLYFTFSLTLSLASCLYIYISYECARTIFIIHQLGRRPQSPPAVVRYARIFDSLYDL